MKYRVVELTQNLMVLGEFKTRKLSIANELFDNKVKQHKEDRKKETTKVFGVKYVVLYDKNKAIREEKIDYGK